jgi:hypothetical protein
MSVEEIKTKALKLTHGRPLKFISNDWIFVRVLVKYGSSLVYEVEQKDIPIYIVPDELYEQYYTHSPVVKLTKLDGDDKKLEHRFFNSQIRSDLNTNKEKGGCPYLIKYDQEGFIDWNDCLYHAVQYDDPCTSLNDWINIEHAELNIKPLEVYRLIRSGLETFKFLESNGYVLTQYNPHNIFAGAYFEDRFNFFRVNFKGHKDIKAPFTTFGEKNEFSPPEKDATDIYKSYEFTLGLLALWSILKTFSKAGDWKQNFWDQANEADLKAQVKKGCEDLYEGDEDEKPKKLTEGILLSLLEYDIKKRKTPKQLLEEEFFTYFHKEDEEEFQREIEENERERKKMEEEEKKNFDA